MLCIYIRVCMCVCVCGFSSVQELHCALSCSVICLCASGLCVRFTLSTHIPMQQVSTLIQKIRIRFTNFSKSNFYHFFLCLLYPFMAKNSKAKLPTYGILWHVQHGHQIVIQAFQVSLPIALGIALHHFLSFLIISSQKTKT